LFIENSTPNVHHGHKGLGGRNGKDFVTLVSFVRDEYRSISETMIHEQLPAVITKIARMLAVKPAYFVTHPSELRIVQALSDSELRDLATAHSWRFVRRVGGRRVEFYLDAAAAYRPL
jgi:hypothetical protein